MTDSTSTSSASVPDWITRLAESRVGLAVLSAAESTVLPIPLEAVLIPLMVGRPSHALRIGLWALLGCLVGSFLLYGAGLLAQPLVDPVLQWLGLTEAFEEMQTRLTGGNLFVTVVIIAVSPAPVQLASLGAGVVGANPLVFLAGVGVSRALRYLGLGLLAKWLGPRLQEIDLPWWVWLLGFAVLGGAAYLLL